MKLSLQELRNKDLNVQKIMAVMYATFSVAKRKRKENGVAL